MNKEKQLTRKLYITAAIAGIVVVASAIIAVYMLDYEDSLSRQERTMKNNTQSVKRKYQNLIAQREKAENSLNLYRKLTSGENGTALSLNKKILTSLLNRLNKKYKLHNLSLAISPTREHDIASISLKTGKIISSRVEISFDSITDEFAFAFSKELFQSLSKFTNITGFNLARVGNIDQKTIDMARTKGAPYLVKGQISFDWLGLKINETYTK